MYLGLFADGGSLPDIIDLWHVIVIQPEAHSLFRTNLAGNEDFRNPFSPSFLATSVSVASLLMIRVHYLIKVEI